MKTIDCVYYENVFVELNSCFIEFFLSFKDMLVMIEDCKNFC